MIHLDTHVVLWLYAGEVERLSPAARAAIESESLRISPVVELELDHLYRTGRISVSAEEIVLELSMRLGLQMADAQLSHVVAVSRDLSWTRDPYDHLIAGHAVAAGARLLTRDRALLTHLDGAFW